MTNLTEVIVSPALDRVEWGLGADPVTAAARHLGGRVLDGTRSLRWLFGDWLAEQLGDPAMTAAPY